MAQISLSLEALPYPRGAANWRYFFIKEPVHRGPRSASLKDA